MDLKIINDQGQSASTLPASDALFAREYNESLVHQIVIAYQANARQGTRAQKGRSDVNRSGKKPWRQKGTGRARAGSFQSPLWRGGGVVFGPKPRDFTKKVSRNTRQLALRKVLTERLRAGDVLVLDDLKLESAKTKEFVGILSALELKGSALIVAQATDKNLTLASRNVPNVALATSDSLNTYDVLRPDKLVFTRGAFEQVEARLTKQ